VLNASLRASYAVKPAKRRGGSEERPAFAAPELVAAAAARALAAERAAKAAAEEPAAVAGNGAPAAAGPADVAVPLPRKRAAAANGGGAVGADEPAGAAPAARAPKRARAAGMVGGGGGFAAGAAMMGAAGGATPTKPRDLRLSDLGGIDASLGAIRENILCPLAHPELYSWLGVEAPRGVLLSGPPGCGKTSLAHAIATEAGVPFFAIAAPEIVSGMSGESEAKLRSLFASAAAAAPSVIFIDEIDAIAPKRESAQREMERRIVAQLLVCLDDLSSSHAGHVAVLGATNRVDALDSALRRAGRFDREITLGVPDEAARARILEVQARKVRLEGAFDFKRIARLTPGYVGADLAALTKEAAALAVARIFSVLAAPAGAPPVADAVLDPAALASSRDALFERGALSAEEMSGLAITMSDYEEALPRVQPSAQREGFATVPDVTWDDVGSLADVREELAFAITLPIAHPTRFAALGLGGGMGVLLYGPPGCGKTLLAKATANDARANFISIKGPELLNKYVGESERAVRTVFARARAASPCVLFFDELDSLAPRRGAAGDGSAAAERVVNQLLTEMDGLDPRKGVYVVAATNRPDMIDPAMLRPGRLDKLLFVPLPPADGRASILRALTRKTPLAPGVDLAAVAQRCDGFSGADLSSLVREASWAALRAIYRTEGVASTADAAGQPEPGLETIHADALRVTVAHFDDALQRVTPSVTEEDRRRYDRCSALRCVFGPAVSFV
jgi:ribosome biogenesis ATPase